jgi:hypothetical protein
MQEQILQLSSTIKPGGATSPLPATPSRNRTNAKIKLFSHVFSLPPYPITHYSLLISHYPYPQIPQSNFYSSWGLAPDVLAGIMAKLEASNRAEAVAIALRKHLL